VCGEEASRIITPSCLNELLKLRTLQELLSKGIRFFFAVWLFLIGSRYFICNYRLPFPSEIFSRCGRTAFAFSGSPVVESSLLPFTALVP
jgi:hypothetical protein